MRERENVVLSHWQAQQPARVGVDVSVGPMVYLYTEHSAFPLRFRSCLRMRRTTRLEDSGRGAVPPKGLKKRGIQVKFGLSCVRFE